MNSGKFASLHPDILARKGDARPWNAPISRHAVGEDGEGLPRFQPSAAFQPTTEPLFPATPRQRPPKTEAAPFAEVTPSAVQPTPMACDEMEFSDLSAEPARPYDPERIKKCTIRMSFIDYERLGIIAVKRNVTRQHLLHEALERCFQMAADEYRSHCTCLGNRQSCCQGG